MKKLLITIALIGVATVAFGQGQVNFLNGSGVLAASTNSARLGTATGLTSGPVGTYYYALFWAPSTQFNPAAFEFVSNGTNQTAGGRFNGGTGTAQAPAITGQAAGTTVNVLFRGWTANFGVPAAKYDPALANTVHESVATANALNQVQPGFGAGVSRNDAFWYGESLIGTVVLGGGGQPIPSPFQSLPGYINQGMLLGKYEVVPEPTTLALIGLGAAGLLIFRRRK